MIRLGFAIDKSNVFFKWPHVIKLIYTIKCTYATFYIQDPKPPKPHRKHKENKTKNSKPYVKYILHQLAFSKNGFNFIFILHIYRYITLIKNRPSHADATLPEFELYKQTHTSSIFTVRVPYMTAFMKSTSCWSRNQPLKNGWGLFVSCHVRMFGKIKVYFISKYNIARVKSIRYAPN